MPQIFDCFTFNDEIKLLGLRLRELSPVVDRFVLVEATRTFTGLDKPLHFYEHRQEFGPWLDRIEHVVVEDMPTMNVVNSDPAVMYAVEGIQRNAINRGLGGRARSDDLVMVSDVDEIPRPEVVTQIRGSTGPYRLWQRLFYYWLNLRGVTEPWWLGTGIARWEVVRAAGAQMIRLNPIGMRLNDAGWHFSFMTPPLGMVAKLNAWSHTEANVPPHNTVEHMARCRDLGLDWDTKRNNQFEFVNLDASFPNTVLTAPLDWMHWVGGPPGEELRAAVEPPPNMVRIRRQRDT